MEKTVKINWEGQPAEVVIGEITWKEKMDAIKKSIRDVQRGRQLKKEADLILQKELMMMASIKKAPFDITPECIGKLNSKDGERIFAAYSTLNDLDEEEGEN